MEAGKFPAPLWRRRCNWSSTAWRCWTTPGHRDEVSQQQRAADQACGERCGHVLEGVPAHHIAERQDLAVERVGGHGTRRVDTRIVVASNRSLATLVAQGRFRADLYYRLNGIDIQVPPLRDRREDVLELAKYFLDRHHTFRPLSLSVAAADALLAYDWPGNVRELERVIERAIALAAGAFLDLDDLPPALLDGYVDILTSEWRTLGAYEHGRLLRNLGTIAPGHFEVVVP